MKELQLGCVARDLITGFKGVVVCRAEWLNGCKRATIQPQTLKEGAPIPTETFDEDQLEVITPADCAKFQNETGGPYPAPRRQPGPVR